MTRSSDEMAEVSDVASMSAQDNSAINQGETSFIWEGVLEWINLNESTSRQVTCQMLAGITNGEAEVEADTGPLKLIIQPIPKKHILGSHLNNSEFVFLRFQPYDKLQPLNRMPRSDFAGIVQFAGESDPAQVGETKMFILYNVADRGCYGGYIPNDQPAFIDHLRTVIQHQKTLVSTSPQSQEPVWVPPPGSLLDQLVSPEGEQQDASAEGEQQDASAEGEQQDASADAGQVEPSGQPVANQDNQIMTQVETYLIWEGVLEWTNMNESTSRQVTCEMFTEIKNREAKVKAGTWPLKLTMQPIPRKLIFGSSHLKNIESVYLHFQRSDSLTLLRMLISGFTGIVWLPGESGPEQISEVKMLILFFSTRSKCFYGIIPKDQPAYIDHLRKAIQHQKTLLATNPQSQEPVWVPPPGSLLDQLLSPEGEQLDASAEGEQQDASAEEEQQDASAEGEQQDASAEEEQLDASAEEEQLDASAEEEQLDASAEGEQQDVSADVGQMEPPGQSYTSQDDNQVAMEVEQSFQCGEEELNQLTDTLKCPVCWMFLDRKVVECVNGHYICLGCKGAGENCPICRKSFSNVIQNTVMRQVLEKLPHRCRYDECSYFVRPHDDHEEFCLWRPTGCRTCKWKGCVNQLEDHVGKDHAAVLRVMEREEICRQINFDLVDRAFFDDKLLSVFGHLLWMRSALVMIQDIESVNFYFYSLVIGKPCDLWVKLTLATKKKENNIIRKIKKGDHKRTCISIPAATYEEFKKLNTLTYRLSVSKSKFTVI